MHSLKELQRLNVRNDQELDMPREENNNLTDEEVKLLEKYSKMSKNELEAAKLRAILNEDNEKIELFKRLNILTTETSNYVYYNSKIETKSDFRNTKINEINDINDINYMV